MTSNGNGGNAIFRFTEKRIYKGTVTSQQMRLVKDIPTLMLGVTVIGELLDGYDANSGILRLQDPVTPEVMLRFDPNRPDNMGYSLEDLERMGFDDDDLTKLNPNHEQHVSLIGKDAFVTPTYKIQGDREACYWNLRFPKPKDTSSVPIEDVAKSDAAAEFRRLRLERKRPSMENPAEATVATTTKKRGKAKASADIAEEAIPF